jgi:hypothetical protein
MREAVSCLVLECQQLPHRQLTLVHSFEISGGSRGNIRWIRAISLQDFPQSPYSLQLLCTKSGNVLKPSPTTGRTNTDGGFHSRICSFFGWTFWHSDSMFSLFDVDYFSEFSHSTFSLSTFSLFNIEYLSSVILCSVIQHSVVRCSLILQ